MSVLLLFIDGVGIGWNDPEINPFAAESVRRLAPVRGAAPDDGSCFRPLDATLGVPGLPQSATGQTTLFTGVNAARLAGRHLQGLPGKRLRPVLENDSMFHKLIAAGRMPTFANGYTRRHLDAKRPRWSATTRMAVSSGTRLRVMDGEASQAELVFHDYTGEWAEKYGLKVPRRTAREAAAIVTGFVESFDLVLFEYFLTDITGHRGTYGQKRMQARRAEDLVNAAVDLADLSRHTVVVVSDHGNLEDGSTRMHTLNPVPLIAWGRDARRVVDRVESMTDLTPALVGELSRP